jgi:hypothetical protein
VAALAASSFLVAACGGGPAHNSVASVAHGRTMTTTKSLSNFDSGALEYSVCMRKHGVADFPVPPISGYDVSLHWSGKEGASSWAVVNAAEEACARYSPAGQSAGPPPPASYVDQSVAAAQCMRQHGVPGFPDPTTHAPRNPGDHQVLSGGGVYYVLPSTIEAPSPQFDRAAATCHFTPLSPPPPSPSP